MGWQAVLVVVVLVEREKQLIDMMTSSNKVLQSDQKELVKTQQTQLWFLND